MSIRIEKMGGGLHTVKISSALENATVEIVEMVDDNPQLHGRNMLDVPVLSMVEAKTSAPGAILISLGPNEDVFY